MRVLDLKIAIKAAGFFSDALAIGDAFRIPFLVERLALPQNSVFRVLDIQLLADAAEVKLQVKSSKDDDDAYEIADQIWSDFLATLKL